LSLNRYFDEYYNIGRKIYIRNSRLLAKTKQELNLNVLSLKKDKPISAKQEKGNNKKSNRISLNNARYYTEVIDYNNGMFDGKHFHFEKKWIKKKNYDKFLEKNRRIYDIALKKTKFRSYGFGVALFFLLFILGIGYALLEGFKLLDSAGENFIKLFSGDIAETAGPYVFPVLFGILIVVLSIIIITVIPKILKNNEKYVKIKLISE
ncbi:Plasmodium exported protein (Pm-fam-a like), unknown function, partial [Plasmodium malariae]